MRRLLIIVGATAGGYVGWALGDMIGMTTAVLLSLVGSGVGWYMGDRMAQAWFD